MIKPPLSTRVLSVIVLLGVGACAEDKVLYEKASSYSTIVVTEDDEGLRTLRFGRDGVRQSVVKVGDPRGAVATSG